MNSKNRLKALILGKLGVVALIIATTFTLFFTACQQTGSGNSGTGGNGGGGTPTPPATKAKHAITFNVEGMPANGTLKAKVAEATGEKEINSGEKIEEGKTITFTATPNDGYKVKEWKLGGKPITKAGTGTEYKHTVTALATITMSFEPIPQGKVILTLDASKHDIKVKAKTKDGSAIKVEGCTVATLESDKYMDLHANGEKVTLIGDIIELYCPNNQLTALDAQSLNSLQKLDFNLNQLTAFNVQGLASLQELICNNNKLSSLDVKDC